MQGDVNDVAVRRLARLLVHAPIQTRLIIIDNTKFNITNFQFPRKCNVISHSISVQSAVSLVAGTYRGIGNIIESL
jgi:hypothetical protein